MMEKETVSETLLEPPEPDVSSKGILFDVADLLSVHIRVKSILNDSSKTFS